MSTQTRPNPVRSERDELERLQQELRELRRRRESLPREKAELASQVERLEREVRSLRQTVAAARGEWEQPAPSLPERLVPPFLASPSRRRMYGRMRYALQAVAVPLVPLLYFSAELFPSFGMRVLALGAFALLSFALFFFFQGREDDDESRAWSFDDEGLSPMDRTLGQGKVLYGEIQKVEVKQGGLERLAGFGSVQVTWTPAVPTLLGKATRGSERVVDIPLLDDPERLAAWLKWRVSRKLAEQREAAHAE